LYSVENFRRDRVKGKWEGRWPNEVCPTPVTLSNLRERKWLCLPCRKRRCKVCGPGPWKRYVMRRIFSGLEGVDPRDLLLLTLTAPGGVDLTWNDEAGRRFGELIRELRRVFRGAEIEYHRVGELHRGGLIHYHVILRGLRFLPHALLSRLCVRVGLGRVCWVTKPDVRRGGIKAWVYYSTKYLVKSVFDWELPQHVCTHSHGWSLNWTRARKGDGSSGWRWERTELDAYRQLERESVIGSAEGGADCAVGHLTTLTDSARPPPEAVKAGARPVPDRRSRQAAPPIQGAMRSVRRGQRKGFWWK